MKLLNSIAGVCSIIGVTVLLFSDYVNSIIALICLICFLIFLLVLMLETVRRFIKNSHVEPYEKVSVFMKFETLESVTFDKRSKSYEYHLISPEVGCFYRIEWEK